MKTILAIYNSSEKGKSKSIREFAYLLLTTYPNHTPIVPMPSHLLPKDDFRLIIDVNGVRVGVESQGDPGTDLEIRLSDLAGNYNCHLIICSCRTRGETVNAVENVSRNFNYQNIWTSTYQINGLGQQNIVNNLMGKHMLELLQSLGLI